MVRDFFKSEGVSLYGASLAPLSKTEEMELAKLAANGDMQARETLIRANIRYALSYAKTFYGLHKAFKKGRWSAQKRTSSVLKGTA